MNGYHTLGYARNRYTGGSDFHRMARQRHVIELLAERASNMSLGDLNKLIGVVLPLVTSNISKAHLKVLIKSVPTYLGYQLNGTAIPQPGMYTYGYYEKYEGRAPMSVVQVNFEKCSRYLYETVYGEEVPAN